MQTTIPGCHKIEQKGPGEFRAYISLKFGLIRFKTQGDLHVEVQENAKSYRLHGKSAKTLFGAGHGTSDVRLSDKRDGGTHLYYAVDVILEGRLAKLGASAVSGQLQSMGTRFFERFEAAMNQYVASQNQVRSATLQI